MIGISHWLEEAATFPGQKGWPETQVIHFIEAWTLVSKMLLSGVMKRPIFNYQLRLESRQGNTHRRWPSHQPRLRQFLSAVTVLCVTLNLCAATKFPDYPVRQASEYAIKTQSAGLTIGVQAVEDKKDQKTYFHTELSPKGFLPVFVVIQNTTPNDSFLFDKTKISYGLVDQKEGTPQASEKAGKVVAVTSLVAISYVGAIVAMKLIADASQVQHEILLREVQSKTLSPGESVHGFLYVPVPKKEMREKIHLRVPIKKSGTDDEVDLELAF